MCMPHDPRACACGNRVSVFTPVLHMCVLVSVGVHGRACLFLVFNLGEQVIQALHTHLCVG